MSNNISRERNYVVQAFWSSNKGMSVMCRLNFLHLHIVCFKVIYHLSLYTKQLVRYALKYEEKSLKTLMYAKSADLSAMQIYTEIY